MAYKTKKAQVVIVALDAQKQSFSFLLLQTNEKRGQFWQNVTGKVEAEESYDEGALREAIEETGLELESIVDMVDLGISHEFIDERKRDVQEKAFLIILDKMWKVIIDPKEHQAHKWVTINELAPDMVKHEGNFEAIEKSRQLLIKRGV